MARIIAIGDIPNLDKRVVVCLASYSALHYFTDRFFLTHRARDKVLKPNGTTVTLFLVRARVCVCVGSEEVSKKRNKLKQ